MSQFITIEHKLPFFSVSKPSEFVKIKERTVIITEEEVTTPLVEVCPFCGSAVHILSNEEITLRDMRLFEQEHRLKVSYKRAKCIKCKFKAKQDIPFKTKHHMLTKRLVREILREKRKAVATKFLSQAYGVDPHIIKELDKRYLKHKYDGKRFEKAEYIAVDEISIHHNHKYATIVINLETGHVLFCEKGKKKDQILHFFERAGKKWLRNVRAVSMDMNAPYAAAFKEYTPHIDIVYDFFHMIKLYNDSVLTTIRRRLQNEALDNGDKNSFKFLKGSRFLVTAKMETLEKKDEEARINNKNLNEITKIGCSAPPGSRKMKTTNKRNLERLLAMNSGLSVAYILAEQFRYAYSCKNLNVMRTGLEQWCELAEHSKVPELIKYSKTIRLKMDGIIKHAKHNINSGRLEGFNNFAKVIKRTGYGFVDDEYYFLLLMETSRYNNRFKNHRKIH